MPNDQEKEKLYIPKSDLQPGPGLIALDEELFEQQDPLKAFNEEEL